MKNHVIASALCFLSLFFLAACASTPKVARDDVIPFTEGNIRIVPPVKLLKSKEGYIEEKDFNDGGTKMITIVDAEGKATDVYFDHRIDKQESSGTVYLNGYPDASGSVRLLDQASFRKKILRQILRTDHFDQ